MPSGRSSCRVGHVYYILLGISSTKNQATAVLKQTNPEGDVIVIIFVFGGRGFDWFGYLFGYNHVFFLTLDSYRFKNAQHFVGGGVNAASRKKISTFRIQDFPLFFRAICQSRGNTVFGESLSDFRLRSL